MGVISGDPATLRRWGWATLIANVGLIVTGGAVRLTGSGLGCPTWPKCTTDSYVPHDALGINGAIEFGNRTLTFVLAAIAIGTFLAVRRSPRTDLRPLALILGLSIPGQAALGGVTVLSELNPWVVSLHLMWSMVIVALAVTFLQRVSRPPAIEATTGRALPEVQPALAGQLTLIRGIAVAAYAAVWVVVYVGTIVTGSGPHAGDADARRNGFDPEKVSQLHADAVFLLVGLTIGWLVVTQLLGLTAARTAVVALLVVELAQGVVGYAQYFNDLPIVLVGLHMLGAAVLVAVGTEAWLRTKSLRTG